MLQLLKMNHHLQLGLLCLLLVHEILAAPLQESTNYQNLLSKECIQCLLKQTANDNKIREGERLSTSKTVKKNVFISRGWGAGGMPFNVLYLNPSHSSKAPITDSNKPSQVAAAVAEVKPEQHKTVPQVRNSMRQKSIHRISHSVIPQLFVSYGWGPHGKK